jgi:hypothetical protein
MELIEECAEIDISALEDTGKAYEPGLINRTINATIFGTSALVVGDTAAVVTCTFGTGGSAQPSGSIKFLCSKNDADRGVDGARTSSVSFIQAAAS